MIRFDMMRDPIVEEVRAVRQKIERECGDDAKKFFEHVQEIQKGLKGKLTTRKPRPIRKRSKEATGT